MLNSKEYADKVQLESVYFCKVYYFYCVLKGYAIGDPGKIKSHIRYIVVVLTPMYLSGGTFSSLPWKLLMKINKYV